jgi:DNA-binding winged helix-turn-helix (wHTH) protein/TolB-like protein
MADTGTHWYEFGPFRLDVRARRLLRNGEPLPLTPKDFEILVLLVTNRKRVVTKAELMTTLWPESFVEEANLTQHIFTLRRALGDQSNGKPYVETIPRSGYRFAAEVRTATPDNESPALPASSARPGPSSTAARSRTAAAVLVITALSLALAYTGMQDRWRLTTGASGAIGSAHRVVAVLPFATWETGAQDGFLGIGLADALIMRLARVQALTVRPTNAVRRYAGTHDAVKAGRELKVQAVLDGSIQRDGNTLRVTAQLISVSDGAPIWTATFDTVWTNIFSVQDAISQQLADALSLKLTANEQRGLRKRDTESAEGYEAYLKSRYFWNKRTADGYLKGIQYAKEAIARDPGYALAFAALADSYALIGSLPTASLSRDQAMALARAAATTAISLDDTLAEAHTSLAFVKMHYDQDWDGADRAFRRAIELNPSYPTAYHWYAFCLTATRRHQEAIAAITRARELDPLSLIISTDVAEVHYYARQYDRAIEQARQTLEMDSEFPLARRVLALALQEQGHYEAALAQMRLVGPEQGSGSLGHLYAAAGQPARARAILKDILDRSRQQYGWTYEVGLIYAGLGDTERALTYLERSRQERQGLILLAVDPHFDRLQTHPRFVALLQQLHLPG